MASTTLCLVKHPFNLIPWQMVSSYPTTEGPRHRLTPPEVIGLVLQKGAVCSIATRGIKSGYPKGLVY
jgi:hypothetical protein